MNDRFFRFFTRRATWSAALLGGALLSTQGTLHAQDGLGGLAAGSAMAATLGGVGGAAAINAGQNMSGRVQNNMMLGGAAGMDGNGAVMPGAGTANVTLPQQPQAWGNVSGDSILRELRGGAGASSRVSRAERRRRARAQAAYARRMARLTPAQRRRVLNARYRKPAVGWLSYYAPEDRYKVTSTVWRYVSIEDDSRAYPVRYYYKPSSQRMLNLLARNVKGQPRRNRVIGFHTWQEAMQAGYRPDPVSRPAPANDIAYLASLTRSDKLSRYVSFVYAGQVAPETLARTLSYVRHVQRTVNSRSDTRPMLSRVIGDVLAAAMGEGQVPTRIGGDPPAAAPAANMAGGGMMPGMGMGMPSPTMPSPMMPAMPPSAPTMQSAPTGTSDARTENYDAFRGRAGNLAAR